jgi:hypothetical protein
MKKSILALGAAAVVGGLGFAGSAHALAYIGPAAAAGNNGTTAAAAVLELNPGGTGHFLFNPYFSTQGTIGTLMNITNTDLTNGKAVKVRFRGAANSDDVLDFTVFLSPGDVWTASLVKGLDDRGTISTNDKSCTLPAGPYTNVPFNPQRVAPYLDAAAQKSHTREGYVEILTMADIPPTLMTSAGVTSGSTNPLYTAIKHVSGVAPCTSSAFAALLTTPTGSLDAVAAAYNAGLAAPTGQLMGSWAIFNQAQLAVYSGTSTAVQAVVTDTPATANSTNGYGNIAFAPQVAAGTGLGTNVGNYTADPLLRATRVSSLWFDLPDVSTPYLNAAPLTFAGPLQQAGRLSATLGKTAILNDYSVSAGAVPMETDWVVSQPTRRYHAAVDYGASAAGAAIYFNPEVTPTTTNTSAPTTAAPAATANAYSLLTLSTVGSMGPYACLNAGVAGASREEHFTAAGADFSPGSVGLFCGEVFTMSFGSATSKVLQAQVANTAAPAMPGDAGWAKLTLGGGTATRLPVLGFAATSMVNKSTNGNFGLTLPHRW